MFRAAVLSLLLAHSEPCETEALSAAPCQRKFGGPAAAGAGCCQALLGRDEGVDASSFLQMGLSLALRPGSRMAGDFSQPGEHRLDRLAELRDTERKLLLQLALAPGRAAAEAEESAERKQAEVEANTIEREVAMLEARISELSRLRDSLRTGKALLLEAAKPNVTHATAARSGQASDTATAVLSPSTPTAAAPNKAQSAKAGPAPKASATAVLSPPAPAAANRPQSAKATTLHIARNASQSASKAASQASAKAVPNPSTQAAAKRMQSTKASLYRYAASGNATPGDAQNASLNASQNDSLNASQNASLNTSLNASDAAGQASEAAGQALDRAAAAGGRGANSTTAAAAAAAATTAEAISSTTTTATSVAASATTTEASAVATNVTSTEAGGGAAWTNTSTSGSGGGASTTATSAWDQGDRRDTVGMTPALRSRGVVSAVIFIVVVLAVIASLIFLVLFRRAEP